VTLLHIKNLSHHFGGLQAVDDFNLKLDTGELVGLIGPNGAGKTTIFNLVTGVYKATAGEILFDGQNLVGMAPYQINRLGISRTFQTIRLWDQMTVLDNMRVAHHGQIGYGLLGGLLHTAHYRREEEKIRDHSLELLDLFDFERYAEQPAGSLPYGERRRLEIIRAMATRPKLLILDEPAAGMNPGEVENLMTFIQWLGSEFKLAIWLIEHQMKLVMGICQRLTVIDFGRTLVEGKPEEIRNNPKVLEAYLGAPADGIG
jgi:branched-chain amino acid transport system ATP-binding protein